MTKNIVVIVFLSIYTICAQDSAYVKINGSKLLIGNNSIERVVNISHDAARTEQIINKISGTKYIVDSDEFTFTITFSNWGPAYSKTQNGENPVNITAKDFRFEGYKIETLDNDGKELKLNYILNNNKEAFNVKVIYKVFPNNFYMRKWIELSDPKYGTQFLNEIFPISLTFEKKKISHGQYGQPVFNNDIFLGVEYPTVENKIDQTGKVMSGYYVGEKITKKEYLSHSSIIGVAASPQKLEQTFMNYVDEIKVRGTRQFLLYNTWYDLRFPWLVKNPQNIMNEDNILNRVHLFKKYLKKYNLKLNAFVIDEGWDKMTAKWEIDSTRFPHGFSRIKNALDSMNTSLGLWASPWGGYEERTRRVKWAVQHGYETSGDFLCFAGTKYGTALTNSMIKDEKKYHIGYFKWDGLATACNERNHGHLPGVYSHEALVANLINMIDSVRQINPDVFINITIGSWLSPWWLKYVDCVWMQGEDYGYAENVPCINDRDKAITYKDGVLWDDFRKQDLLFPLSSIMTHGIIKGSLNLLGGRNETLDSFSNEVMMYFGRGVMMWELYLSPDLVSDNEWKAIASTVKWAKENKSVLSKTKMILGNPLKKQPYGYIHLTNEKGILLLRNPNVLAQNAILKLSENIGDIDSSSKYYVKIIYPYNKILPTPIGLNDTLSLKLEGYEILTAELIPTEKINRQLPVGIKYSIDKGSIIVYGRAGTSDTIEFVNKENIGKIKFGGDLSKIKFEKKYAGYKDHFTYNSDYHIDVPENYKSVQVALLIESKTNLKANIAPEAEFIVNGERKKINVQKEGGSWFWLMADLNYGENNVSVKIDSVDRKKWKIGEWIFADEILSSKVIKSESIVKLGDNLPARPYPADISKIIIPLSATNSNKD